MGISLGLTNSIETKVAKSEREDGSNGEPAKVFHQCEGEREEEDVREEL
jgi:hypothetical protein